MSALTTVTFPLTTRPNNYNWLETFLIRRYLTFLTMP